MGAIAAVGSAISAAEAAQAASAASEAASAGSAAAGAAEGASGAGAAGGALEGGGALAGGAAGLGPGTTSGLGAAASPGLANSAAQLAESSKLIGSLNPQAVQSFSQGLLEGLFPNQWGSAVNQMQTIDPMGAAAQFQGMPNVQAPVGMAQIPGYAGQQFVAGPQATGETLPRTPEQTDAIFADMSPEGLQKQQNIRQWGQVFDDHFLNQPLSPHMQAWFDSPASQPPPVRLADIGITPHPSHTINGVPYYNIFPQDLPKQFRGTMYDPSANAQGGQGIGGGGQIPKSGDYPTGIAAQSKYGMNLPEKLSASGPDVAQFSAVEGNTPGWGAEMTYGQQSPGARFGAYLKDMIKQKFRRPDIGGRGGGEAPSHTQEMIMELLRLAAGGGR